MEVTKEQILELMTSAYMAAHQQTVDGVAMSCRQGTFEECEDIFESEFEQSPERVSVNAIVMGKSVIRILKDYNPSYKELIKIKEWVESEFQKSHKRSMEPEQTRFKETYP